MRQSLLLLSSLILTMLLLGFIPAQSGHESTLFGIEAQVSDIKKTTQHCQQFLDSHSTTSYIPIIESDILRLENQVNRLKTSLNQSSPSLSSENHDDTTLHK